MNGRVRAILHACVLVLAAVWLLSNTHCEISPSMRLKSDRIDLQDPCYRRLSSCSALWYHNPCLLRINRCDASNMSNWGELLVVRLTVLRTHQSLAKGAIGCQVRSAWNGATLHDLDSSAHLRTCQRPALGARPLARRPGADRCTQPPSCASLPRMTLESMSTERRQQCIRTRYSPDPQFVRRCISRVATVFDNVGVRPTKEV